MLTFFQRRINVMQQLGEYGVAGFFAGVLGLKPNLFALNVNQALGMPFEPQRFDVGVFDIFFGVGFLEGGVEAHGLSVAASWRLKSPLTPLFQSGGQVRR
jgi:hypothetical protein